MGHRVPLEYRAHSILLQIVRNDVTSAARSSAMTGARRSPLPSGRDPRLAAIAEIALSKKETPTPGRRGLPVCPRRVTWCRRALKTAGSVCMSRPALSNCHSGQMSVNGGYRLCDRLWKGKPPRLDEAQMAENFSTGSIAAICRRD